VKKGPLLTIGLLFIVAFGGTLIFFLQKFEQETQEVQKYIGPVERVTLGVEKSLVNSAILIAESEGYFKEYGLEIDIKETNSGSASLTEMFDGNVDISAASPTAIMFKSLERNDFYYFGTFVSFNEDIKLTARKDLGIITPNDLKGKKIGTAFGTTGQYITDIFLIFNNIPASDVEVINFKPSELPNALYKGDIDAMIIWEPHGSTATNLLGSKSVKIPISDIYTTTINYLVMKDFAKENPEILVRFLRAVDQAIDFINNNKQKSLEVATDILNLNKEESGARWDDLDFELSIGQAWIINMENEARWAIAKGLTDSTEIPNYLNYIYFDALEAVNPDIMTITKP
jgi:ABC-type nitrate/sulfonate/bicarbonate transport system substrate-binding protein